MGLALAGFLHVLWRVLIWLGVNVIKRGFLFIITILIRFCPWLATAFRTVLSARLAPLILKSVVSLIMFRVAVIFSRNIWNTIMYASDCARSDIYNPGFSGLFGNIMGFVNAFLPMTEGLALLVILLSVRLYRVVFVYARDSFQLLKM